MNNDNDDLNSFYYGMNSLHINLIFTLEKLANNKLLLFLDTEVILVPNKLHKNFYRKPTDTNLLMQYTSV